VTMLEAIDGLLSSHEDELSQVPRVSDGNPVANTLGTATI
jgi:hypothetical protein